MIVKLFDCMGKCVWGMKLQIVNSKDICDVFFLFCSTLHVQCIVQLGAM